MKVIKASVDLTTWCFEFTCKNCKSIVGVEATDIRYKWDKSYCYYHVCCLCNVRQYIGDNNIPEIVKADVKKHRSDPVVYLDD